MKRITRKIAFVLIIGVAAMGSLGVAIVGPGAYFAYQAWHLRMRLLCETDHTALLEACRQLSKEVREGRLEPGSYSVRRRPSPEARHFPEAIRALRPDYVFIDRADGHAKVVMLAGRDNFGVYAYPEDFKSRSSFEYRDKQLLEGLWYYDDFYKYRGREEWDRRVDRWLSRQPQEESSP